MVKLMLICVIYLFLKEAQGALNGNCDLENVSSNQWLASYSNGQVDDNHQSEFHNFKATNVASVQIRKNGSQYSEYFEVELTSDKNNVIVTPSTTFQDFERHEVSDPNFRELYVILEFKCEEGNGVLAFYQPIKDLNSFNPEMTQSSYTYELPMPLPSDFNLACLGHTIEACDYDITNSGLNFSVTPPDDFSINWEATIDERKKCHRATITTKQKLRLTEDTTYNITVTDVGNPPKQSSSTLTIKVDEHNSFPLNPQFESASYTAIYNIDDDIHKITLEDPIRLIKENSKIKLNILGDHKNHFEANLVSNEITVTLKGNLPENVLAEESSILITIEAILEDAEDHGRAVLLIQLPEEPDLPPNPQFEHASYIATYNAEDATHNISVNVPIHLKHGHSNIKLNLLGDYKNYFEVQPETEEITVTLITNLPDDVLLRDPTVILTIEAILENAEGPGTTALVVEIPKKSDVPPNPQFESASYTAKYNADNQTHSIIVDGRIQLKDGYSGITLNVIGDYKDSFEAEIVSDQITVTLIKHLPDDVLLRDRHVIITIQAILENAEGPGTTALVVEIPKKSDVPSNPQFESASYTAKYNVDNQIHSIIVDGRIQLKDGYSGITLNVIGDYKDSFEAEIVSDQITVTLIKHLPDDVLLRDRHVIITIQAILENAEGPGTTALVVEIPKKSDVPPNPQFESASYTAKYNADNQIHSIIVDGRIQLKDGYSGITLNVIGDYKDSFEAEIVSDQITVTLIKHLPDDVLLRDRHVIITIQAILENAEGPGTTALVVEIPKKSDVPSNPQFESASYTAKYNVDNQIHSIIVDGPIQLKDGYSGIKLNVEGDYKDSFEAEIVSDQITVTLIKHLPDDVLLRDRHVIITIQAILENAEGPGTTALVVEIPKISDVPPNPQFESASYTANYNADNQIHSISVDGPIQLKDGYSGITLNVIGDHKERFEAKIGSDQINVTLIDNLPDDVLAKVPNVIITIEAILENAEEPGRTVVVIQLPPLPPIPTINFERGNYQFKATNKYVGFIGLVRAKAIPGETIEYSLEGVDGAAVPTGLKYDKNTGALNINTELDIGDYLLLATAKGTTSSMETKASVVINIYENIEELHTPNSIIVRHVIENSESDISLPCETNNGNCHYEIFEQHPSTSLQLFEFREGRLHHRSLDREMEEIKDMHVSQFLVSLRLVETEELQISRQSNATHRLSKRNIDYDDTREWIYVPDSIVNKADQLLVSVIIDDVNDNSPVFQGNDKLMVGYPKKELAAQLSAPYLTKVQATDADIGVNADISYSTTSPHFIVHQTTGVVYPTEDAFKDNSDLKITVTATDLGGSENGLSSSVEIEIIPLEEQHLTIVTIKNLMLEDIDYKLAELSEKSTLKIKYLTAAVVPSSSVSVKVINAFESSRATSDHFTKVIVYALNNNYQPVETEELKKKLEEAGALDGISVSKWESCSTIPEPPSIAFERDNYYFETRDKYVGFIGLVKATAESEEDIKYSLEGIDGSEVPKELEYNEDTGALTIADELSIGEYSLLAVAKGATSNIKTQTSLVISVYQNEEELRTTDSIVVKHVTEKEEASIEMPCEAEDGDCEYEVFDQYPPTTPLLFKFREGSLHCGPLDRQMEEVKNMIEPQFTVSLRLTRIGGKQVFAHRKLNNSTHWLSKRNAEYADADREWVYIPENVVNKADQILVSVLIDDINDNPPVFEEKDKLIVGYPMKELAIQLAPPYLTKVHATDLDVGLNAVIKYTTSSSYFIVHQKTGVVYPTENAFENEENLEFKIIATDMNGHEDGNKAELEVEIIPLDQKHLTVLTMKNLVLEDVDGTLQELSQKTNIQMKYLTASVVPSTNTKSTKSWTNSLTFIPSPKANSDHFTRIVMYALDSDDEPVETDKIQEKLTEAGVIEDISVDKWNPPSGRNEDCDNTDDECSTAGFIAAISVLASLLVIFLIGAAAFYYFKIYRVRKSEPYASMEEEDTGSISYEKKSTASVLGPSEEIAQRRPTGFVFNPPPLEEDDEDEYGENKVKYENPVDFYINMKPADVENKVVYDNPVDYIPKNKTVGKQLQFADTTDSMPTYDFLGAKEDEFSGKKLKSEESPPEQRDRAKSVSFKPTVQKINIVVEDKSDDILDERL